MRQQPSRLGGGGGAGGSVVVVVVRGARVDVDVVVESGPADGVAVGWELGPGPPLVGESDRAVGV